MGKIKNQIDLRVWLSDLTYTGQDRLSLGADTFPLAVGCIATYAESKMQFSRPIRLFRYPEMVDEALKEEGPPHLFGLSNFIWNSELSLAIARRVKELSPETIIVMGGPNYPLAKEKQESYLQQHPEIDFYVLHEGEVAFLSILKALNESGMDFKKLERTLPSVQFIDPNGKLIASPVSAERIRDLDEIPSPYVTGKFDEFFDGRLWPILQTKRGCPFKCTFCTEGMDYYTKIARFSVDFVRTEVEYIGRKMEKVRDEGGRNDLYIADSNFGMYEEDIETAKALASSKKNFGWPDHINCSTGKNKKERVLEVAEILDGGIVLSGSVQTLDLQVLENVKRKNISPDELMELAKEAENVDANSYCELILGLPGESRDSHFRTLEATVKAGFNKIIPYQLMILQGSDLGTSETIEKFEMELRSRVLPRAFGAYDIAGKMIRVADIEDVCVASNALSYEDYLECRQMHLIITIFYNDVIFATVMKTLKTYGLSVFRWLELILEATSESSVGALFEDFRKHTDSELWKDKTELEAFIQNSGVIEKYRRGEIGFNLLYTFKALAFTQYLEGVEEVAAIAIRRLLKESKRDEDPGLVEFFNSAVCWDTKRMTGILEGMEEEVSESMAYDMSQFVSDDPPKDISHYTLLSSVTFKYVLTEEQKEYVSRNLVVFGNDAPGVGRLLSNAHTCKLLRMPIPLESGKEADKVGAL
jgi:radical SAM superfamily enzyme YgiQ (UPF0313 family)